MVTIKIEHVIEEVKFLDTNFTEKTVTESIKTIKFLGITICKKVYQYPALQCRMELIMD